MTSEPFGMMGSPGARPDWYDRAPLDTSDEYFGDGLAPHSVVTRDSYTVPSGRKATVESAFCALIRVTAASAAGRPLCDVLYQPGGAGNIVFARAWMRLNGVGDHVESSFGARATMLAGDALANRTWDDSTGGTVDYAVTTKVLEFDQ